MPLTLRRHCNQTMPEGSGWCCLSNGKIVSFEFVRVQALAAGPTARLGSARMDGSAACTSQSSISTFVRVEKECLRYELDGRAASKEWVILFQCVLCLLLLDFLAGSQVFVLVLPVQKSEEVARSQVLRKVKSNVRNHVALTVAPINIALQEKRAPGVLYLQVSCCLEY